MSEQEAEQELDEILSELIDRAVEVRMTWNKGGSFTRYQDRLRMAHAKSEAAIASYTAKQIEARMQETGWMYVPPSLRPSITRYVESGRKGKTKLTDIRGQQS